MVKVNTWVFILRRYKWHIHAGSWSLVNCWREGSTLLYKGCSWILMNAAVGLTAGLGLDGDRCIRRIPRHPPFSMKEEALPACKETIVRNIPWSLRGRVMQQIWMYYKEKLTKNLADQYIRDQYVLKGPSYNIKEPYSLVYLHMYTLPSSGSEVLRSYSIHW